MRKRIVERKDYLKVLVCMDEGSIAITLGSGLKLDDIRHFELYKSSETNKWWIRVETKESLLNLRLKYLPE